MPDSERERWIRAYLADKPVDLPLPEHDEGECTVCDERRAWQRVAEAMDGA
jgi:hypothetical protein